MTFLSLLINTAIFFFVMNYSYFKRKKENPDYPDKPVSQVVLFPLAVGIVFSLIVDSFRGACYINYYCSLWQYFFYIGYFLL